jgi:antitoxin VapB
MSLNIKNAETIRLVRKLAQETGESMTQAVSVAVSERLNRLHHLPDREATERADQIRTIARDAAKRWIEPYRSSEHDHLLYDELGLPK